MSTYSSKSKTSTTSSTSAVERQRKQTANRDASIRKKLEKELTRKDTKDLKDSGDTKLSGVSGAVGRLRPSAAVTVSENTTIAAAAKIMAGRRVDALIIVADGIEFESGKEIGKERVSERDEERRGGWYESSEVVAGIVTDKDFAMKVVGEGGYNVNSTTVSAVMTRKPTCVWSDSDASEALLLMARGRFRHLPVLGTQDRSLVGVLDIIKCLHDALAKLDRAYASATQLYNALENNDSSLSLFSDSLSSPEAISSLKTRLRQRMTCPPISSILNDFNEEDSDINVPKMSLRATVHEAAKAMKAMHVAAVLVVENSNSGERLAGIFTTKDIVLRVLGNGLDPATTTLVRVMTPHPTTVTPQTSVLDALKLMQQGKYLHLPVVAENGQIFGLVDVLQLTYTTIAEVDSFQNKKVTSKSEQQQSWSTFWNASLAAEDDRDYHSSAMSDVSGLILYIFIYIFYLF